VALVSLEDQAAAKKKNAAAAKKQADAAVANATVTAAKVKQAKAAAGSTQRRLVVALPFAWADDKAAAIDDALALDLAALASTVKATSNRTFSVLDISSMDANTAILINASSMKAAKTLDGAMVMGNATAHFPAFATLANEEVVVLKFGAVDSGAWPFCFPFCFPFCCS
jgi:hypothetical protein